MQLTAIMRLKKETKGAVQYEEVDGNGQKVAADQAVFGGCYIRKSALGTSFPPNFTLTATIEGE